MKINLAYQANDSLGEGPVWVPEEQTLYWVDIVRPALQRWHPASGEHQYWEIPSDIGCFALRERGGVVVALRTGFAFLDLDSGQLSPKGNPETEIPSTRFNDGKCDRRGRFWAGTMDEETPHKRGALYRMNLDGSYQQIKSGIGISNGLGWSPDNKIMYYTDSIQRTIWAYDFDIANGTISNERIFARTPQAYVPDGLTVDAEGYVWSAKWDGWKIVRYAPDGNVDLELKLPVQRPTSCMFGGPELKQLFITSASIDLDETELQEQPLAGSIFMVETDTQGLPEPRFAG